MHALSREGLGPPAVFVGRAEEVQRLGGMPRCVRSCLREQLKDAVDVSEGFTFIRDA